MSFSILVIFYTGTSILRRAYQYYYAHDVKCVAVANH